jgi:hypothetical protein
VRFILLDDIAWRQQYVIERGTRMSESGQRNEARRETQEEKSEDDTGWPD